MQNVLTALLVPALFLGPGYGLLPSSYPRRLRLPFVIFVSFSVTSVIAVGLSLSGCFSLPLLAASGVGFLALRVRSKRWPSLDYSTHRVVLGLMVVLVVFVVVTAGEPFDANGDSGVYTIAALHLDRSGSWSWPLGELIPDGLSHELVISTPNLVRPWREIGPGFVVNGDTVTPQFFPLYSVWGAVFARFLAGRGLFAVNLLGALMLLLGIDALGRLFLRPLWRLLALLVVVLNPVFLIFLKYTSAEVFLAGILAGWLYWTVLFLRSPTVGHARLPAVLLALAIITKFFAWAVAGLLVVFLVMLGRQRWRASAVFLAAVAAAAAVDLMIAAPHIENHLGQLGLLFGAKFVILAGAALVLARVVWSRLTTLVGRLVATAYALTLPVLWFLGDPSQLRDFAALSGGWMVLGSALGSIWFLGKKRALYAVFPAVVVVFFNVFLFAGSGDSVSYPFAARRFVPLTIPLGAVFLAYLMGSLARMLRRRWPAFDGSRRLRCCAGILVVVLLGPVVLGALWSQRSAVLVRHGAGFSRTLDELRRALPDGEVVFAIGRSWRYAPHLLLGGEKLVFCVDVGHPEAMARTVQFLDANPEVLLLGADWRGGGVLATVEEKRTLIERTTEPPLCAGKPGGGVEFCLAEFEGLQEPPFAPLDVGGNDRLLVGGCFAANRAGERSYRWTGRKAWLLLPPGRQMKFIWSKGAHPEASLPVRIYCRGELATTVRIEESGWFESRWIGMPGGAGRARVELRTHTFEPAEQGRGGDRRQLGLKLDRVLVR